VTGFLSLRVEGGDHAAVRLQDIARRGADPSPVWPVLAARFTAMEREQFATEGHGGWPPLAASTLRSKPLGQPMMRRTDRLYESLTGADGPAINEQESTFARFGTDVPYARYHQQQGGRGGRRGNLPQRKLIDFTPAERAAWKRIVRHYIVTGQLDAEI